MSARMANIFSRMWTEAQTKPDVKVNLVRANSLVAILKSLAPWGLPLGLVGGDARRGNRGRGLKGDTVRRVLGARRGEPKRRRLVQF